MKSERPIYLLTSWDQNALLRSGTSKYPKVNLRRNGLSVCYDLPTNLRIAFYVENIELIDIRSESLPIESGFWCINHKVIDKKKFFLARIRLGI